MARGYACIYNVPIVRYAVNVGVDTIGLSGRLVNVMDIVHVCWSGSRTGSSRVCAKCELGVVDICSGFTMVMF